MRCGDRREQRAEVAVRDVDGLTLQDSGPADDGATQLGPRRGRTGGSCCGGPWRPEHRGEGVQMFSMFRAGGVQHGQVAVAERVPERLRGKYFSRRRQWGILSAILISSGAGSCRYVSR